MKKIYIITLLSALVGLNTIANAQAPTWLWAHSAGGTGNDYSYDVATDAGGNILVTGGFYSPSITFGTTTLTNAGGSNADMFIVKYDGAGNVLWAASAGGTSGDIGLDVATDAGGNVLVTGYFDSPSVTFGTTVLTNSGSGIADVFIVKYDGAGNVLWANSAGGTGFDQGYSVATDAGGNVLVTGSFTSPSVTFGTTVLTNAGNADIFVVKYDGAGNVLWVNSAGGTGSDNGHSVATDASGNVLVTGRFFSPSLTFGTTVLTNAGNDDIFAVKYDGAGNVLWANSAGGTGGDTGYDVATDAGGYILVTGRFTSPSITFGTTVLTHSGGSNGDMFIVKYDGAGNALWANSAGGTGNDAGLGVATDAGGNVLVTGFFGSSITFGTTVLTNAGSADIFVVKYAPAGNVLWADSAGGTDLDVGNSVATDAGGNVLVTGNFASSSITFGTTVLTNASSSGSYDMFIAKLDNTTGIEQNGNSLDAITVSPNPFTDYITIQYNTTTGKEIRVEVFDLVGQTLPLTPEGESLRAGNGETKIDMRSLSQGIYFVKVNLEGKEEVKKVVKY